ncbi:minor tail protein [Mycobacterium phage OkiRoe]|uniref:minor tail protein n=1 Tax=Mycobacterium phage OkiRoe TaxID=1486473 RepID=UPI00045F70AD|nr:minor tail protein [Mycobacterium phage OkiRoe]AHZ95586.1 minor tail protein [Mycobacterium phage OkiRoe]
MPRAYDRRQLVIDRSPLWSLMPQLPKLDHDAPTFYSLLIDSIKNLTGIDLTSPETLVASISDLIVNAGLGLAQIAQLFGFIDVPKSVEQLAQWLQPHLFGQIPSWRLGNIPAAHIGNFNPELLDDPGFDYESTIAANPNFEWDGDVGRGTQKGSARTTADGTARDLRSNRFEVSAGQKISVRVFALWEGLEYTAGAGGPIRLSVTLFNGDTIVTSNVVSSVSPVTADAADWAMLAGEYQIPAGVTVTHAAITLSVGSEATAGSVWFDDGSARKVGLIAQELVAGLQAAIQERIDEFRSVVNKGWEALTGLPATVDKTVDDLKNALQNIPQGNVKNLANALADAGQDIRDAIVQALGGTGTGHNAAAVIAALQNIPQHVVHGLEDELADAGDAIADVFEDVRDTWKKFWNGIFKTPNDATSRSASEVEEAASAIATGVSNAQSSALYTQTLLTLPRFAPRWLSSGPQDDVAFPVSSVSTTVVPALGQLVLIPVTAEQTRTYESVKFGLVGAAMNSLYVGIYRYIAGNLVLDTHLGNVKSGVVGTKLQAFNLETPISATRGETLYIGVLQVGGTASPMMAANMAAGVIEPAQEIPTWIGSSYGSGMTSLPASMDAGLLVEQSPPLWGALGAEVGAPTIPPSVYYFDNFNRADGLLTTPWVAGLAGQEMMTIVGNRCRAYEETRSSFYSLPFGTLRQQVKIEATHSTNLKWSVVFLRVKDNQNFIRFRVLAGGTNNRDQFIDTCIGGVYTQRAENTSDYPQGGGPSTGPHIANSVCVADGNTYSVSTNGGTPVTWVDSGGVFPSADPTYNKAGIGASAPGFQTYVTVDNFEMMDL